MSAHVCSKCGQPVPTPFRKAREEAGLTQVELAEAMDCSQATVSRLESGELEPEQTLTMGQWAAFEKVTKRKVRK